MSLFLSKNTLALTRIINANSSRTAAEIMALSGLAQFAPDDLTSMFQDAAGSVAVTAHGDPIRLALAVWDII